MYKKILMLVVLVVMSMISAACGSSGVTNQAVAESATTAKSATMVARKHIQQIELEANGKQYTAELEDNALTKKLLEKMPTTLKMQLLENWIYGDEPIKAEGNFQKNLKKGDLAYCRYGYLILFFEDQSKNSSSDFIKVGHITSNIDSLQELSKGADVKFFRRR